MRRIPGLFAVLIVVTCLQGCRATPADLELAAGGQAYLAQCAVCHGAHGGGDGPLAASIAAEGRTRPARLDDVVRIGDLGREGVRLAIEGRDHHRPGSPMPAWGAHLGPPWMDRIAGFVSTMPSMTARERAVLDRYLAAPPGTPVEGRRVYVLYCSGCHGAGGEGQGFYSDAVARRMQPGALAGPRIAAATDAELAERIGMGGAHAAEAATMPGWINTLSPLQRRALLGYLRHLASEGVAR